MDTKPNVYPTRDQRSAAEEKARLAAFQAEKNRATQEIYDNATSSPDTPAGHMDAVEMMRRRTEAQKQMKDQQGVVRHPELAEQPPRPQTRNDIEIEAIKKRAEEQLRIRDEHLNRNVNQTNQYQEQYQAAYDRTPNPRTQQVNQSPVNKPYSDYNFGNYQPPINHIESSSYIESLSQPNFDSAFDIIPLPSEGKTYRLGKPNVKVSYLTAMDESILTSPNLLQSGKFLEILINRKLLEDGLRYNDLLLGDRHAIMVWLRATAYGEMYPVTLFDENDVPFDTEIDLNQLRYKPLLAEPDNEGLFDFTFPVSKARVKFRLVTCGMEEAIEAKINRDKENEVPVNNLTLYTMEAMVVEVNGNRDANFIREFVRNLRIGDTKSFSDYIEKINCGLDTNITVGTPGGGSVTTFLPFSLNFFWPDLRI
jgi:hypothetical protein